MKLKTLLVFLTITAITSAQVVGDTLTIQADQPSGAQGIAASAVGAAGNNNIYYYVAARYPQGLILPGQPVLAANTVGIANLTGANYVQIGWRPAVGATGYYVIRGATPNFLATGACVGCVVAANIAATGFSDVGGAVVNWPPAGVPFAGPSTFNLILDNVREASTYLRTLLNGVEGRLLWFPDTGTAATVAIPNNITIAGTLDVTGAVTHASTTTWQDIMNLGTAAAPFAAVTGSDLLDIRADDAVATGYTDAIQVRISASGGAGTGAVRAISPRATAANGSQLVELYGVDGWAIIENSGDVTDNVYGVLGSLQIDAGATVPTNFAQGVLGILDSDVSLGFPAISGAVTADVTWAANPQEFDGAFVAFRNGGGPGGTEGAAFKLKRIATNTIDEFTYGLDLYGGAAVGGDGVTNSIRGELQSIFDNEAALIWRSDSEIRAAAPAAAYLDWSARAAADVYGFYSAIESDLTGGTTSVFGANHTVQGSGAVAGGQFIGVRGTATQEAGVTGTDILTGVYGSAAPVDGLMSASYGVFGIWNPTGTAAAGANLMAAGVKGDYDDTVGLNAATNYTAGVMGVVSDQDTVGPDGAVSAVLMGGGTRTAGNSPVAAYSIMDLNAGANISFNYGFDAYWTDGAGLSTVFNNATIRGESADMISNALAGIWSISRGSGNFTGFGIEATVFANLGTPADGTQAYCSNCDPTAGAVLACTSAGAASGAYAFRINGGWDCISR